MDTEKEAASGKRGGSAYGPLHIAQMIAVTALLILASVAFITEFYLAGWILMLIGGVLAFLNGRG